MVEYCAPRALNILRSVLDLELPMETWTQCNVRLRWLKSFSLAEPDQPQQLQDHYQVIIIILSKFMPFTKRSSGHHPTWLKAWKTEHQWPWTHCSEQSHHQLHAMMIVKPLEWEPGTQLIPDFITRSVTRSLPCLPSSHIVENPVNKMNSECCPVSFIQVRAR